MSYQAKPLFDNEMFTSDKSHLRRYSQKNTQQSFCNIRRRVICKHDSRGLSKSKSYTHRYQPGYQQQFSLALTNQPGDQNKSSIYPSQRRIPRKIIFLLKIII